MAEQSNLNPGSTNYWKSSAVLAGSAGISLLVSGALADRFIDVDTSSEAGDDTDLTDEQKSALWKQAGIQVLFGIAGGYLLRNWNKQVAVGVLAGAGAAGAYKAGRALRIVGSVESAILGEGSGNETETSTSDLPAGGRRSGAVVFGDALHPVSRRTARR